MSTMTPDTSPAILLARFRGPVTDVRPLYPERILVEVTNAQGGVWSLVTGDADYSPSDPETLIGKTVERTALDEDGTVVLGLSEGTEFTVTPYPIDEGHEIENWSLFMPDDLVLLFGPSGRRRVVKATDPC